MAKVVVVHWRADQADQALLRLRRAGHEAHLVASSNIKELGDVERDPPDALLIDLGNRPATGRDVAIFFRRRKATRQVPLVLLGGVATKVELVRRLLPDAAYGEWRDVERVLAQALRTRRRKSGAEPAVPGAMAPFAERSLRAKLGLRPGTTLALLSAPRGFEEQLGELPPGLKVKSRAVGAADMAILFATRRRQVEQRLPLVEAMLGEEGALWVAWPKRGSGAATDLGPAVVRRLLEEAGWVDYKIAALDGTWSGLKFAHRRFG
jgi:hypothetical protein